MKGGKSKIPQRAEKNYKTSNIVRVKEKKKIASPITKTIARLSTNKTPLKAPKTIRNDPKNKDRKTTITIANKLISKVTSKPKNDPLKTKNNTPTTSLKSTKKDSKVYTKANETPKEASKTHKVKTKDQKFKLKAHKASSKVLEVNSKAQKSNPKVQKAKPKVQKANPKAQKTNQKVKYEVSKVQKANLKDQNTNPKAQKFNFKVQKTNPKFRKEKPEFNKIYKHPKSKKVILKAKKAPKSLSKNKDILKNITKLKIKPIVKNTKPRLDTTSDNKIHNEPKPLIIPTRLQDYIPGTIASNNSSESLEPGIERKASPSPITSSASNSKKNWPSWKYYVPKKSSKVAFDDQTPCKYKKMDVFDGLSKIACLKMFKLSIEILGKTDGCAAQDIIDISIRHIQHEDNSSFRNYLNKLLNEFANSGLIRPLRRGTYSNIKGNLFLRNNFRTPSSTKALKLRTHSILERILESKNKSKKSLGHLTKEKLHPLGFFAINKKYFNKPKYVKVFEDEDLPQDIENINLNINDTSSTIPDDNGSNSRRSQISISPSRRQRAKHNVRRSTPKLYNAISPISTPPKTLAQQFIFISQNLKPIEAPPDSSQLIAPTPRMIHDANNISDMSNLKLGCSAIPTTENWDASNSLTVNTENSTANIAPINDKNTSSEIELIPNDKLHDLSNHMYKSRNDIQDTKVNRKLIQNQRSYLTKHHHLPNHINFNKNFSDVLNVTSSNNQFKNSKNIGMNCSIKDDSTHRINPEISVQN